MEHVVVTETRPLPIPLRPFWRWWNLGKAYWGVATDVSGDRTAALVYKVGRTWFWIFLYRLPGYKDTIPVRGQAATMWEAETACSEQRETFEALRESYRHLGGSYRV